jgi:hypothetical protein
VDGAQLKLLKKLQLFGRIGFYGWKTHWGHGHAAPAFSPPQIRSGV